MFSTSTHDKTEAPIPGTPKRTDQQVGAKPNPLWQSLALRPDAIQRKLIVSQPDDPYEREADHMADRVVRMATPSGIHDKLSVSSDASLKAQRKCAPCEEAEEEKVQRKEQSGNDGSPASTPAIIHQTLNSSGQPLDRDTRSFMEERFGYDFKAVRVHDNREAAAAADAIHATAYTVGSDIAFGAGSFNPATQKGRLLLAHELSHVAQQQGAQPAAQSDSFSLSSPVDAAEREAAVAAESVLAGRRVALTAQPPAGQTLRDTGHYETKSITLDPAKIAEWKTRSYWEQKVLGVIDAAADAARFAADPEEREAVFAVLWDVYQKIRPIKAEVVRPVTIPARGAKSKVLSYVFTFKPPKKKGDKERVDVQFEAEGAGATPVAAPTVLGYTGPGYSFSSVGFPGKALDYFKKFPAEKDQLFTFLDTAKLTTDPKIVTTSSGIGKTLHESTLALSTTNTPGTPRIQLVAQSTPASASPPAGYASKDYADFALEEAGKDKAAPRTVNLPVGIPPDEVVAVKYAVWQYFQGGTRDSEVDAIVPIPGKTPKSVLYTLKFHGKTNVVDLVRIGVAGSAGTVDPAKIKFNLARIPDFAANSKDVATLSTWLGKRYRAISAKGKDVPTMKLAAEAEIETAAVKDDWFAKNYKMDELKAADAVTRLTTKQNWLAGQTKDTKDFTAAERKLLELALESVSDALLALISGVPLARQKVLIENTGTDKSPVFREKPETAGVTAALTTTVTTGTSTVATVDRTIVLFNRMFEGDAGQFIGDVGTVAPASLETPLHEFGHVVGGQAGIKAAFEDMFMKDKAKLKTDPITWYAKKQPGKDFFAEAFALYHADPKWMETNLPQMYAWFQTLSSTGKPP